MALLSLQEQKGIFTIIKWSATKLTLKLFYLCSFIKYIPNIRNV